MVNPGLDIKEQEHQSRAEHDQKDQSGLVHPVHAQVLGRAIGYVKYNNA
jgi:hypothetical protein